jgi:chromosomal replication initiation ATPase DnaA
MESINEKPEFIFAQICGFFNLDLESVYKKTRFRTNVEVRQIYFAIATTSNSLRSVGNIVSLTHSTVLYGRNNATQVKQIKNKLKKVVDELYPKIDFEKLVRGELWEH